jgi:hypothetical protein
VGVNWGCAQSGEGWAGPLARQSVFVQVFTYVFSQFSMVFISVFVGFASQIFLNFFEEIEHFLI